MTPYEELGGAEGLRKLVNRFYDLVEMRPEAAPIARMHNRGHGFAHARDAQYQFLSGFLGGPQLYMEHFGHVNVRLMHAHLVITAQERDGWLLCMGIALDDCGVSADLKRRLMQVFTRVAEALRNSPELTVVSGKD